MTNTLKWLAMCLLIALSIVYAFVSAPPPLNQATGEQIVPIERVLEILEYENDQARALYTEKIVGDGKKQGITFDENWAETEIHAGLLPAQFLRETARYLEQTPLPIGLFLGSDYAINSANGFSHEQLKIFETIKLTKTPVFLFDKSINRYSYMFPDVAISIACIQCHNKHADSPKKDWRLQQVMGATTWTYPDKLVSVETALHMLSALRAGIRSAYSLTLAEAEKMPRAPKIGHRWPKQGRYLPSANEFMDKLAKKTSKQTLDFMIKEATNENR